MVSRILSAISEFLEEFLEELGFIAYWENHDVRTFFLVLGGAATLWVFVGLLRARKKSGRNL